MLLFALKIVLNLMIVGLVIYLKLLPHKEKLNIPYNRWYNRFDSLYSPILSTLKQFMKPHPVGGGVGIDMTHIVLLVIMLILLNLL